LAPAPRDAPVSGSSRANIVLTAANASEKLEFYREILGLSLSTGEWEQDAASLAALGLKAGRIRRTVGVVPGTDVSLEIVELDGVPHRRFFPVKMGAAGVGWLRFVVRDLDALMATITANRVLVVSTGLQPVQFADSRRVVVRDPDGVLVELIEYFGNEGEK
jgi:catechol 2,3-dioxygenase-like lactoylglutathione lyase family enzyme